LYAANYASAIVGPNAVNAPPNEPQSHTELGGIEFVFYTVGSTTSTGLSITIQKRNLPLRHLLPVQPSDGLNRFMPTYSYGSPSTGLDNSNGGNTQYGGSPTAFIP